MRYFGEFRLNWRALVAACVGMGFGYGLNNYFNNVFIPPLMHEFGWTSSQIALIGIASILSALGQPIAGRFTDRFGVRTVALFGVSLAVLIFLLLSRMQGPLWQFFVLNGLQIAVVSGTTASVVYSRLVAQSFSRARGFALGLVVCSPSVIAVAAVPMMSSIIEHEGWRTGYLVTAGMTLVGGAVALLLIPGGSGKRAAHVATSPTRTPLRAIFTNPAFAIIIVGLCLCSLSISMQVTQLKVLVESLGLTSSLAAWLISVYAAGVIFGRLVCGVALDALPTHVVSSVTLGLPGIGLAILATGTPNVALIVFAVLLLGLSFGAEGDIAGYLTVKYFPLDVYSTVLGFFAGAISLAAAIGAVVLGLTLGLGKGFTPFLVIASAGAFIAPLLFWRLRHRPAQSDTTSIPQ